MKLFVIAVEIPLSEYVESLQYYDYLLVMNESGEIVRYMVDSDSETAILPEGKLHH